MSDENRVFDVLKTKREALRSEIQVRASVETQLLMQYLDVRHDEIKAEFKEILRAYETLKGMTLIAKWLAGIGASLAVIWATLHSGGMK